VIGILPTIFDRATLERYEHCVHLLQTFGRLVMFADELANYDVDWNN
jgi:hypothetical protein